MVKAIMLIAALTAGVTLGQAETPIYRLKTTGPMNAGGNVISNLAPGVAASDAATAGQVKASNDVLQAAITAEGVLRVAGDAANSADILLRPTFPATTNIVDFIVATSGGVMRLDWQAYANAVSNALSAQVANETTNRVAGDLAGSNYAYNIYTVLSGDVARATSDGTNYTDAVAAGKMNTNAAHSSLSGIQGAGTLHVTASETNKINTAWQNPASATNWTWTSDGTKITLTGYSGPADVVVPDTLDNLPVTGFGTIFSGVAITSISGGGNVGGLDNSALFDCTALTSVSLSAVTNISVLAIRNCAALMSVSVPSAVSVGIRAFQSCVQLTSIRLPYNVSIGGSAFKDCPALTSVYFGQNAPAESDDVYLDSPNATNYVTNPQATGWGATWNGRPVVRLPVYADEYWRNGTNLTDLLAAKVSTNDTRYLATLTNTPTLQQVVNAGGTATNLGDIAQAQYSVFKPGYMAHSSASSFGGPFGYMWWPDKYGPMFSYSTNTAFGYIRIRTDEHEIHINDNGQDYPVRSMLTSITNDIAGKQAAGSYVTNTPAGIAAAGGQLAETVVTGAVVTVSSGNRYFFTTATNVTLTASLTGGQVINYVALRNTATNSVTAIGDADWKWTGGAMTNTIPASTMMTFGFACNPFTGVTNAYATAASVN